MEVSDAYQCQLCKSKSRRHSKHRPVRKRIESVRETAHKHNVKILISLAKNSPGEFTTAINDPKARKELIQQIIAFTKEYKLDGFDIDYEEYDNWDKNFPSLLVFARWFNT